MFHKITHVISENIHHINDLLLGANLGEKRALIDPDNILLLHHEIGEGTCERPALPLKVLVIGDGLPIDLLAVAPGDAVVLVPAEEEGMADTLTPFLLNDDAALAEAVRGPELEKFDV